jgi:hypothetical protein
VAARIQARDEGGRKVWYVWCRGREGTWLREYPQCATRDEFYHALRQELGLPPTAPDAEVVSTLADKTWRGGAWVDDFHVRLRKLCRARGLSEVALLLKVGLSIVEALPFVGGRHSPTDEMCERIAAELGVPTDELLE